VPSYKHADERTIKRKHVTATSFSRSNPAARGMLRARAHISEVRKKPQERVEGNCFEDVDSKNWRALGDDFRTFLLNPEETISRIPDVISPQRL
jgi:hypothetical protein